MNCNLFRRGNAAGKKILGLVYPPRCPVCDSLLTQEEAAYFHPAFRKGILGQDQSGPIGLCRFCIPKLTVIGEPVCLHCGRPVDGERTEYCFDCKKKDLKHSFYQGKALFLYKGGAPKMMYRFKYGGRQEYGDFFALTALRQHGEWLERIHAQAVLPVPMYDKKRRLRGYNQAESFGRQLAILMGIPCWTRGVRRIRDTQPMKELDDAGRKINLRNAFQATNSVVKYKRVLVVDDIYTTGSTADEVADTLMQAGVERIYFLSLCIGRGC